jgi:hypothetical protein
VRYAVTAVAGLAVLVGCGADPPLEQASGDDRAEIETCRRAGEQDARDDEAAQERIARQVMLEMIRSGRIRDPRE